jgi:Na+/H+-translocating membrane pyrophosphatase
MTFFERISNGWNIALDSWKVLRENKHLIIFPILSTISLIFIVGSFFVSVLSFYDWDISTIHRPGSIAQYLVILAFYVVNYFIVVFFNVALVHCVSMYFKGEKVSVKEGIQFSMSRIGSIFAWAVFAGLIGAVLKIIQENTGTLGKIITGLIGIVWGIATFFVVPVIAYENLGPVDAFKRSAQIMRDKWGQRVGAGFSFGLISLACFAVIAIVGFGIGALVHPIAGVAIAILAVVSLLTIMSALKTIFISAVYHNVNGDPVELYNQQFIDNLFVSKK